MGGMVVFHHILYSVCASLTGGGERVCVRVCVCACVRVCPKPASSRLHHIRAVKSWCALAVLHLWKTFKNWKSLFLFRPPPPHQKKKNPSSVLPLPCFGMGRWQARRKRKHHEPPHFCQCALRVSVQYLKTTHARLCHSQLPSSWHGKWKNILENNEENLAGWACVSKCWQIVIFNEYTTLEWPIKRCSPEHCSFVHSINSLCNHQIPSNEMVIRH